MSWHFLVLLQAFFIAIGTIFIRAIARHSKWAKASFVINAISTLLIYLALILALPFLGHVDLNEVNHYFLWFAGGGITFSLSAVFTYKLLTYLDAGMSSVLGTMSVIFTVVLASVILHENVTAIQAAGTVVLLSAITYMLLVARVHTRQQSQKLAWLYGFSFAFIAAVCYSVGIINEKYLLSRMNLVTYIFFGIGAQVLAGILLAIIIQPHKFRLIREIKLLKLICAGAAFRAASAYLFLVSLIRSNNAALVTVVSNFRLVVIILLGAWFLRERQRVAEKLAAAAVSLVGLGLIFWK